MDTFQRLESRLRTLTARLSEVPEHVVLLTLDEVKDSLKRLLVTPPRDPIERAEIESGRYSVQGHPSFINAEFKQEALFLAEQLDCSEFYCAQLLEHALRSQPNPQFSRLAEKAVILHHQERIASIRCLKLVVETATRTDVPNTPNVAFVRALALQLIQMPLSAGLDEGETSLAIKLLTEMDKLLSLLVGHPVPSRMESTSSSSAPLNQAGRIDIIWADRRAASVQERTLCAHVLYLVSACGQLRLSDVTSLVKWLSGAKDYSGGIVFYVLACVLVTINPSSADDDSGSSEIYSNSSLFVSVNTALNSLSWGLPRLRAALLLQWSLFVLEVRGRDPNLLGDYVVVEDEVGTIAKEAIQGDAFQALMEFMLRSRGWVHDAALKSTLSPNDPLVTSASEFNKGGAAHDDAVDPEFRVYFAECMDRLLITLITRMSRVLRDVRKHEEDVGLSWVRAGRSVPYSNPYGGVPNSPPPRRDIETLFRLIATVYDDMPLDSALDFWTERNGVRLTPFLKWAAESRQSDTIGAMYDMLASLSRGPSSAIFAYNFLSTGGNDPTATSQPYTSSNSCSWPTLFMAIHHYENQMPHGRVPASNMGSIFPGQSLGMPNFHQSDSPRVSFPPEEIKLLGSFLKLLGTVARYSVTARVALHENHDFRVVQSLFNLASHPIPLELKAILFDTLSAFSTLDGGNIGIDIVHHIWNVLEKTEIIPIRQHPDGPMFSPRVGRSTGGAVIELEQVESAGKTYPATIALVRLLDSLVHVPAKPMILRKGLDMVTSQTMPDQLGSSYRAPGLRPYVDFVVERVFLKVFERDFTNAYERWQMYDACLGFFEKALAGFDLGVLSDEGLTSNLNPTSKAKAQGILAPLAKHPGFSVMKWILTVDRMQENLLYLVDTGFEAIFPQLERSDGIAKSAQRSLRVIWRVILTQSSFVEGLVPLLNDVGDLPNIGYVGFPASTITPLDLAILQKPSVTSNIAMFVTLPGSDMPLYALQILEALSHSAYSRPATNGVQQTFDPLAAALRSSTSLGSIIQGFRRWLEADVEDVCDTVDDLDLGSIISEGDSSSSLSGLIRSTALRLLIANTKPSCPSPNISHVIMGFDNDLDSSPWKDDQATVNNERGVLHSVFALLGQGLSSDGITRLAHAHPAFAEQCFRLVNQLCTHPYTSPMVVRYLRVQEHFFQRQLLAAPIKASTRASGETGVAKYADGMCISTTCDALSSSLRMNANILDATALELHMLTEARQKGRAAQLVDLLFDSTSAADINPSFLDGEPMMDQPLSRILSLLEAISVTWEDPLVDDHSPIPHYENFDITSCLRVDAVGYPVYDLGPLLAIISEARRQLHRMGSHLPPNAADQLKRETQTVLRRVIIENRRRAVEYARGLAYIAWARLLSVTLMKAFDHLPADRKENILYDILQALSDTLSSAATPNSTTVSLSSCLVLVLTKLRETVRRRLNAIQEDRHSFVLPIDRLHLFFKSILSSLIHRGNSEAVRGNFYAVLVQYLHFALEFSHCQEHQNFSGVDPFRQSSPYMLGQTTSSVPHFLGHCLSIFMTTSDRVLQCVCRDATDGSEIWKTIAFALLEVLVRLSQRAHSQKIETMLAKDGHIQNFLQSLLSGSHELQCSLGPDAGSLNALYVYEAKMSLLIRVAQTPFGAAKLNEARLYHCLSQCDFIDVKAIHEGKFEDSDAFLPSIAERYRQILEPMLRLAVSCVMSCTLTTSLIKQAVNFIISHREVIVSMSSSSLHEAWTLGDFSQRHLAVALMTLLIPQMPSSYLGDTSTIKPVHGTIMSLADDCLNLAKWDPAVAVPSPSERMKLSRSKTSSGKEGTLFSENVRNATILLHRWISLYVCYVLDTTELASKENIRAPTSSVTDISSALSYLAQCLERSQRYMLDIDAKLQTADRLTISEALEILQDSWYPIEDSTDILQLRYAAWQELHKAWQVNGRSFVECLCSEEVLLWMLWRKIAFPSEGAKLASSFDAMRRARDANRQTDAQVRETVIRQVIPTIDILKGIPYAHLLGTDAGEARKLYLQLLGRHFQGFVGHDGDWEFVM